MSEENQHPLMILPTLAVEAYEWPLEEWGKRTWYGRLVLPIDYVCHALTWVVVLGIVSIAWIVKPFIGPIAPKYRAEKTNRGEAE